MVVVVNVVVIPQSSTLSRPSVQGRVYCRVLHTLHLAEGPGLRRAGSGLEKTNVGQLRLEKGRKKK